MYLRRKTRWSMARKRYRVNWFLVSMLTILIGMMIYVERVIVPTIPPPFVPTPTPTRSPESYVAEAEAAFGEGKLVQAMDLYQQAIQADPQNDALYVALARVQIYATRYPDAQNSAEAALLLNANNPRAHAMRAWALSRQGDYLAAEAAIKRALEIDPNSGLTHAIYTEILIDSFQSGVSSFASLEKAIEQSRLAISLEPNTIEAHYARGYVLEATGNYQEALEEYQAALAINPNLADLHLALGRNYRILQVYDLAIEAFTRANALNPADPMPDLLISRTWASIGEFAKAAQYAESAVKDAPGDPRLRGNYGVMLYRSGDWVEAAIQLGLAIHGGRTEQGETIEGIPLTPDLRVAEYYFTYALALARLNRCSEAIPVANLILGRLPSDEVAVANANKALEICEQNLSTPSAPSLPVPVTVTPTP